MCQAAEPASFNQRRFPVALTDLGDALVARAGEVPGDASRRDGRAVLSPPRPIAADLDRLPWPDRTGPARPLCGVPTAYLMGSRGCVSDCDYCCITTLHRPAPGPRFRQRKAEDVADEMADLYHRRGVRQFVFHDDNFLVPSRAHNRERIGRMDAALAARDVRDVGLVLSPYRQPVRSPSAPSFEIRTVPAVPLWFRAAPVVQPFAYLAGRGTRSSSATARARCRSSRGSA